jgi:hypothetical protein|tara:strand:- start:158 stop:616 length:459 start_codon:yes stop_codon:yes gene_type:complete
MASTISSADLKVTIKETIELNGKDRGSTNTLTVGSINEVDNRIITLPSGSQTTLFNLSNNPSAGTFLSSSLKYARITNKDDSYHVRLRVSSSLNAMDFKIEAGKSFLLSNSSVTGSTDGLDLNSTFDYGEIKSLKAEPSGSDVDVELFLAST